VALASCCDDYYMRYMANLQNIEGWLVLSWLVYVSNSSYRFKRTSGLLG